MALGGGTSPQGAQEKETTTAKRHQTERKEDAVYHDSFDMADTGLEFPIQDLSKDPFWSGIL